MPDPREHWTALTRFIEQWYFKPDHDALLISMGAAMAQYLKGGTPVWLFVVGQAGSGKTSVIINCLDVFPEARMIDELTERTFLSGYRNGSEASLLHQIGSRGILLFPDFTVFLSEHKEAKAKIAGQLRRIYDGRFDKRVGTGHLPAWEGKISVIAAVTESIDYQWQVMQELGQRFVMVRWPDRDGVALAGWAERQEGYHEMIKREMQRLSGELMDFESLTEGAGQVTNAEELGVHHLAQLAAMLRGHVRRDAMQREVIGRPSIEAPTRIAQAICQIARGIATIFRRLAPSAADVQLASRVALDSIPLDRRILFDAMPDGRDLTASDLEARIRSGGHNLGRSTIYWIAEELVRLGVLEETSEVSMAWKLTDYAQDLKHRAILPVGQS